MNDSCDTPVRDVLPTVIVKVGGSLLDLPDLGQRLRRLADGLSGSAVVFFPGGGAAADLVRDWQPRFQLTDDAAHWLAVEALRLNARLLKHLIPRAEVVDSRSAAQQCARDNSASILDPCDLLSQYDATFPDEAPPHHWDVTSDSLAAWLALRWQAARMVLLKSTPCPRGQSSLDAVRAGLVDPYFPGLAGRLPRIDWCCLRDQEPTMQQWLQFGAPQ